MYTPEEVDKAFSWEIESRECLTRTASGELINVRDKRVLVRTDRELSLGVVSNRYGVVQPSAMMSLLHAAAGDGLIEYVNGGSFEGGKRIYLQVLLKGANFDIAGQEHAAYFLLGAHNDGTGSVFWAPTPTRLFCMNQLRIAIDRMVSKLTLRHTKNAQARLEQATEVVRRTRGYFGAYTAEAQRLVKQTFSLADMRELTETLWPTPKSEALFEGIKATRAKVVRLFDGEQLGSSAIQCTKYGALNAVVEYIDHHQHRKGGEAGRQNALLFGSQTLKQLAYERLAA